MDYKIDILILTASFGSGHSSAAIGIKENIQNIDPNINIEIVDTFQILMPRLSKTMYKYYEVLICKSPKIYNYFHYKDNEKPRSNRNVLQNKYLIDQLKNYIEDINPGLIISTFPVVSQYLSILKKRFGISIPMITCITDVVNGWEWITPNCDKYFVATKSIKDKMIKMDIEPQNIIVTGIPLRKNFLESKHMISDIFSDEHKVIMVMGGGMGLVPDDETFYRWMNDLSNSTVIVLTGKNEDLYKSISKLELENIIPLKYTDQVYALMAQSDILISKAGGITLFEAISSDLPFIAYKPELGQEVENAEFIRQESIGDIALNIEELKSIIIDLINNKKRFEMYKTKMDKLKEGIDMNLLANESICLLRKFKKRMIK